MLLAGIYLVFDALYNLIDQVIHSCCGASTEMIRDVLGHGDVRTTQTYLSSFEDSQYKKYQDGLLKF